MTARPGRPFLAKLPKPVIAKAVTATLKAVKEMRPAPNEIIVCTGLGSRGGVQYWGSVASGLMCNRRQKG